MHARALAAIAVVAAACGTDDRGRAPQIDLAPGKQRVAVSSSSATNEVAPPAPVTVSDLVASGTHWRLVTPHGPVHVWIPPGYKRRRADTVVYVHGFYTHVDQAWQEHKLAAQFAASGINAMFIAPEAPAGGSEPVSWTSVGALLDAVEQGIAKKVPRRRLVALGHSGAWKTLIGWLDEPILDTTVLFDAAYGEIDQYKKWILGSPKRRLITVGDDTRAWTEQLHAQLPGSLILEGFPDPEKQVPAELRQAQIVYIRSSVGHFPLVTGGIALPLVLRMLRAKLLFDTPLADLLEDGADEGSDDD